MSNEDIKVIKSLIIQLNEITKRINTLEGFKADFKATVETFHINIIRNNQYVFGCSTVLTEEKLNEKINRLNYLMNKEWK